MNAYPPAGQSTHGLAIPAIAELIATATGADIEEVIEWLESGDVKGEPIHFLIAEYRRR